MFCQHRAGRGGAENGAASAEKKTHARPIYLPRTIYNEANELRPRVSRHQGGSVPRIQSARKPKTAPMDDLTGPTVRDASHE